MFWIEKLSKNVPIHTEKKKITLFFSFLKEKSLFIKSMVRIHVLWVRHLIFEWCTLLLYEYAIDVVRSKSALTWQFVLSSPTATIEKWFNVYCSRFFHHSFVHGCLVHASNVTFIKQYYFYLCVKSYKVRFVCETVSTSNISCRGKRLYLYVFPARRTKDYYSHCSGSESVRV